MQTPDPTVKLEKSVLHGKYQKGTLISSELSTKFRISSTDKSFDNLTALARALGASNLLSLVDGSRLIPEPSTNNANGSTPSSITESDDPLSLNRFVVVDEDDIFRYAEEETTAFRFIESFPRFMQEKGIPKGRKFNKSEKENSMKNNNSNGTNGMHNTNKIINDALPLT